MLFITRSQSTAYAMLFMYNRNNKGPRMDPLETPHRRLT